MSILSKAIGKSFLGSMFGLGQKDPNVYDSLMGGGVGRIAKQQENLANQMLQGVPQQQQQQVFSSAADEAAMQNQMAQQNLAMSGMSGGGNYGNMLSAMTQNRMQGGAAQQIAALQPSYQQMGANMLSEVRGIYEGANQAQLESDLLKRQRQKSNLWLVGGILGNLAFPGFGAAISGGAPLEGFDKGILGYLEDLKLNRRNKFGDTYSGGGNLATNSSFNMNKRDMLRQAIAAGG